ncbi:hypothetical protein N7493_009826 [Penicillium malachiteum]|uniref:Uncharacterized protein n=1 Tax=Penicillium malachiteum TaxID=1324776 RepID=A0AAD6MRX6_9EURO|nr:hypothetical protein N7493_009826 [Penicillium malachiteum]
MDFELNMDSPEPEDFVSNFTYQDGVYRWGVPGWDKVDWSIYCISCALSIGDISPDDKIERWLKHYRALYLTPEGAKISGINVADLGNSAGKMLLLF